MLKIDPNISIYVQIAEYLRIEIFSGSLKPGDKLLSIRDMAIELEVNPNTIKRVYQELLDDGLIYTNKTLGNFVTEDKKLIEYKKKTYLINKTKAYVELLKTIDVDIDKAIKAYEGDKNETND